MIVNACNEIRIKKFRLDFTERISFVQLRKNQLCCLIFKDNVRVEAQGLFKLSWMNFPCFYFSSKHIKNLILISKNVLKHLSSFRCDRLETSTMSLGCVVTTSFLTRFHIPIIQSIHHKYSSTVILIVRHKAR